MKVTGSATVAAPRERVYEALRDPAVLARTIPGCRSLDAVGPDAYRMTISAGVAAIRGTYEGSVALSDPAPPESFTLRAQGQGAPGTVDATVRVMLSEADGEGTRVEYDADATVGGMVGGVGQRLLAGAARKTATEFFAAVARDLTGLAPAPGAAAGPGGAVGAMPGLAPSGEAGGIPGAAMLGGAAAAPGFPPAAAPGQARAVAAGVVAGVVAGAVAALAGVALGARLARRGGR